MIGVVQVLPHIDGPEYAIRDIAQRLRGRARDDVTLAFQLESRSQRARQFPASASNAAARNRAISNIWLTTSIRNDQSFGCL